MTVQSLQRFRRDRPCPVCGGFDEMPRGQGNRCHGFASADGMLAHCARPEHAGALPLEQASQTFAHRLSGECGCGMTHGASTRMARRVVATYEYTDESGALLYRVERTDPKGFWQRRPHFAAADRWIHHLDPDPKCGRRGCACERADFPPARRVLYRLPEAVAVVAAAVKEPEETGWTLFIVEGEKDADALDAIGLAATCNPGGAGKWRDEYADALRGAPIVVIADKDRTGREHADAVARSCVRVARSVRVLELPGDDVKDAADWISAGGTRAQLEALVREAPTWSPPPTAIVEAESAIVESAAAGPIMPSPREPMRVAEAIIGERHRDPSGALTLRSWRGGFYRWGAGRWAEIEDSTVRATLYGLLRDARYIDDRGEVRPWAPNRHKIADLFDALKAVCHTPEDTEAPSWLDGREGDPPAVDVIALSNGLLHIPTRRLQPHTPRFFNTVAVPFPYEPSALPPRRWLAFLRQLWPDDPEAISTLAEWFGYVIAADTRMHKILLIVGPFRSGKGTIGRVLQGLVGKANTSGPTLASLSTNFGLQDLIGKTLALVADARLGGHNTGVVVERLLSISGEDALTVDRKYKSHWFGRLHCRFVIMSNELPGFGDASGAIATRFVVLTLTESWLGREDHDLTGALLEELPGILNWSLDGLDRLRERGRFTEPESARDAILALRDTVSPMSAFVRDVCIVGAEHEVGVNVLYGAWRAWCDDQGRDRPGSTATFGKNLRAVVPTVKRFRPRDDGDREYRYAGIRLRTPDDPEWPGPGTNRDRSAPEEPAGPLVPGGPGDAAMWSQPPQGDDPMLRAALDSGIARPEDVAAAVEVPF